MPGRPQIIVTFLTSAVVATLVQPADAQWLNYPESRTPRMRDGKPNLSAPAARAANGKPDLSGVWKAEPTPLSEIEKVIPHFGDIQIDEQVTSKYILNLFWGLKREEEPLRAEAAAVIQQLIVQQPKNGKYYKLLGDLYDNNNMPAKAGEVY